MVTMSTAISATDTAMDRCDRLDRCLERVEAAIEQRDSSHAVVTGGGYQILNPGLRRKKIRFNGLSPRQEQLVQLHRRLTSELADHTAELLEHSAAELRLGEAQAA